MHAPHAAASPLRRLITLSIATIKDINFVTVAWVDCDKPTDTFNSMAKLRRQLSPVSRRNVPLTSEEFASLKEVGNRPMQRTIPDEHRDRLVAVGYIREVVRHSGNVSALALTGQGIRRLASGK